MLKKKPAGAAAPTGFPVENDLSRSSRNRSSAALDGQRPANVAGKLHEIDRRYAKLNGIARPKRPHDFVTHRLADLRRLAAHRHREGRHDVDFGAVAVQVVAHPRINGRQLGQLVKLTWDEKYEKCTKVLRTIAAVDLSPDELAARTRERRNQQKRDSKRRLRQQPENWCAACGVAFTPHRRDALTCSPACRKKRSRQRRRVSHL